MKKKQEQNIKESIANLIKSDPSLITSNEQQYIYSITSQSETILFKFLSKFSLINPSFRIKHPYFAEFISKIISKLPSKVMYHNGIPLIYFLNKNGKELIRYVFISILLREPTQADYQKHLHKILTLQINKIEFIRNISESDEAKKQNIKIIGLNFMYNLYSIFFFKIPIFSKILRITNKFISAIRLLPHFPSILSSQGEKINNLNTDLSSQSEKINKLKENNFDLDKNYSKLKSKILDQSRVPDDFYLAFENQFRGSTKEIINRLSFYKKYLDIIDENNKKLPFLDIGCGRGEWLSLIKKWGFKAIGIDSNKKMIDFTKNNNLSAVYSDALSYMKSQRSESYSGISGFHILEHLENNELIELVKETSRLLVKNGIVIFETPNPENLIVGSCNFYHDLTHKKPLHPSTIKFIFSFFGFQNVKIVRLRKMDAVKESSNKEINSIASFFNNHQDFAIIAYK